MKWIDLSRDAARLRAFQLPDGTVNLILLGIRVGSKQAAAIQKIGFKQTATGRAWYRQGTRVTMGELLPIFPNAFAREFNADEVFMKVEGPQERDEATALLQTDPIGLNYLGQEVFEGETGRFIRTEGKTLTMGDAGQDMVSLFLQYRTDSDLALCADGFVEEMEQGKVMRADELRRFAAVVHGERGKVEVFDARLRKVQEAVEAAIQRRVSRKFSVANEDAYRFAVRMIEHQPPMIYRTGSSVTNQQYSTPLPMSIAAQRLLGDTSGKRVFEPTIGNGSLVMVLPQETEIDGIEIDPARVSNVSFMRPGLNVKQGDFLVSKHEGEPYDYVISNPPFGGLDRAVKHLGLNCTRLDHLIVLKALERRADDGRSVFIIGADRDNVFGGKEGLLLGGSKNFFNWLADHYVIDDVVELDGSLYEKQGAGVPVRLITVGRKRSADEAKRAMETEEFRLPERIPVLRSWDALWNHVNGVAERLSAKLPEPQPEVEEEEIRVENEYQAPYVAASKVGEATAMIPRNLVAPTAYALSAFQNKYGQDVDSFVKNRLQLMDEQLVKFSPEQIDSIALGIKSFEEGRGLIVGDMTGQGKGRILAGFARYAALREIPVVFLTEKPNLFTDFWRDLRDTGTSDLFNPVIMNDGVPVRDHLTNEILVRATQKGVVQSMMESHQALADSEYNLMFATYSQFNRDPSTSKKSFWLPVATNGSMLILDESHNAAGESNTANNVAAAVDSSAVALYSSATYAKAAKNMRAYSRAFPSSVSISELADTLEVGGEPLQEILSAMLAEDGVFVRREHDLSNLKFSTLVDSANQARNEELSDKLSDILLAMSYMSGDVGRMAKRLNAEIKVKLEGLSEDQRRGNRMGVSHTNFGSRLYNILRQFSLTIGIDFTADEAVKALMNGQKPVIVLEQTMEQLLKESLFEDKNVIDENGDEVPVSDEDIFNRELVMPSLNFRDVLYRVLDRIQYVIERDAYGNVTRKHGAAIADDPEQAEAFDSAVKRIRAMIGDFPALPVSPIDTLREKIEAAGFKCGEISGRAFTVSQDDADPDMIRVSPRNDNRLGTIYDFNNGGLDAVILTRAGSTGLSLHSSEAFKDKRQRKMFELQIANNVNERVQFFGRVNRRGQVNDPEIASISTGLPAQIRVLAMQNQKLRKLSANTQSNRNNAAEMKDIPDILNPLGNKICKEFLENEPEIAMMLDIDMDQEEVEGGNEDGAYFANKLTGRIALLKVAEQRRIYDQITTSFEKAVQELESKGENPFKTNINDWKARVVKREILTGSEAESYDSVFDKPVYLTQIEFDVAMNPVKYDRLLEAIEVGKKVMAEDNRVEFRPPAYAYNNDYSPRAHYDQALKIANARFEVMKQNALPDKFETIEDALADTEPNPVKNVVSRQQFLQKVLAWITPGSAIRFRGHEDEIEYGVVTHISLPEKGREALLGHWEVSVIKPGASGRSILTLNQLSQDADFGPSKWVSSEPRNIQDVYDGAPSGLKVVRRNVLTGNLFSAAEIAARGNYGRAGIFTDENGVRHHAVILKSTVEPDKVKNMPIRIDGPDLANAYVESRLGVAGGMQAIELIASSDLDRKESVTLSIRGNVAYLVVPGTKAAGGHIFGSKEIIALTGEFSGNRTQMRADFPVDNLHETLIELYKKNVVFYIDVSRKQDLQKAQAMLRDQSKPAMKLVA